MAGAIRAASHFGRPLELVCSNANRAVVTRNDAFYQNMRTFLRPLFRPYHLNYLFFCHLNKYQCLIPNSLIIFFLSVLIAGEKGRKKLAFNYREYFAKAFPYIWNILRVFCNLYHADWQWRSSRADTIFVVREKEQIFCNERARASP